MIDLQALSTFGALPLDPQEKILSLGTRGRFPTNTIALVNIPKYKQEESFSIGSPFDNGSIKRIRDREDEELILLIKIFLEQWHL